MIFPIFEDRASLCCAGGKSAHDLVKPGFPVVLRHPPNLLSARVRRGTRTRTSLRCFALTQEDFL